MSINTYDNKQIELKLKNLFKDNGFIVESIDTTITYGTLSSLNINFKLDKSKLSHFALNNELRYLTKGIKQGLGLNKTIETHKQIKTMYQIIDKTYNLEISLRDNKYNNKDLNKLNLVHLNYDSIKVNFIKLMKYNEIEMETIIPYQYKSEDDDIFNPLFSEQIRIVQKFKDNINNKIKSLLLNWNNQVFLSQFDYLSSNMYLDTLTQHIDREWRTIQDKGENDIEKHKYEIIKELLYLELHIHVSTSMQVTSNLTIFHNYNEYFLSNFYNGTNKFTKHTDKVIIIIYKQVFTSVIRYINQYTHNNLPNLNYITNSSGFNIINQDSNYIYLESKIKAINVTYNSKNIPFNIKEYNNIRLNKSNYKLEYNLDKNYIIERLDEIVEDNVFYQYINKRNFYQDINDSLTTLEFNLFELNCHIEEIKNKF